MLEEPSTRRGQMACSLPTRPVGSRKEQGKGCEKGLLLLEGRRTAVHALACPEWGLSAARAWGRGLSQSSIPPAGVGLPCPPLYQAGSVSVDLGPEQGDVSRLPHRTTPGRPDCGRSMTGG